MARLGQQKAGHLALAAGGLGQAPFSVVAWDGDRVQHQVVGGSQRDVT